MKKPKEVILKYEDRLLKNEKSWRRARIGAVFLFCLCLAILIFIYSDELVSKTEKSEGVIAISIWCFFWVMIFEILTLRIRHIDSVNMYRNKG